MKMNYKYIREKIPRLAEIERHSCVNSEDELVKVLDIIKPSGICVEIGTYKGLSTAVLTAYFEKVYTFDVEMFPIKIFIWDKLAAKSKIDDYIVRDRADVRKTLENLKFGMDIDLNFGFIDAIHDRYNVEEDTKVLRGVGIRKILYHDVNVPEIAGYIEEIGGKIISKYFGYWEEVF